MNTKYKDVEVFKKAFYINHPYSKLKILRVLGNNIEVQDKYGICLYNVRLLLAEGTSSIRNAVNKTSYWVNKAKEKHKNKYDYSLVNYVSNADYVKIICPIHGQFRLKSTAHLRGRGCQSCGIDRKIILHTLTTKKFIEKANLKHSFKYDYSLVDYKNCRTNVNIICKIHGTFSQNPNNHLNGRGCQKCKNELTSLRNIENPTGWVYSNWERAALKSNKFDSFKVYVIKCWNENETFYKIGKTFTTINRRFRYKTLLPYNYEILNKIEGNSKEISDLENKLKKQNYKNKYVPNLKFKGMYECFTKIENYEKFFT